MDRPQYRHPFLTDPFAKPERDLTPIEDDPWGLESEESPDVEDIPASTHDIREVYLRSLNADASSAVEPVPETTGQETLAARVRAKVESYFPSDRRITYDRRIVAGLGLFGVAALLVIGLSRFDFTPSIATVSDGAVERLASAANAARDLVGKGPVAPARTEDVALTSRKKVPSVKPTTGERSQINSSTGLPSITFLPDERAPASREERVEAFRVERVPAFRDERLPEFRDERVSIDGFDLAEEDPDGESAPIYSADDADVSPPVVIRSPGMATDRSNGDKYVAMVEILVSETGRVQSARGRQRPATLGAALQSNTALSVVKTWRFRPARKNGQPVKYRTTVPFIETLYPAGTTGSR